MTDEIAKKRREAVQRFKAGEHYVPIAGLPEWQSRWEGRHVEEQLKWRELIREADKERRLVKCISCAEIMSIRNRNVQVLSDGRVRCAPCRVL